jgi:SpoVK/Ycf46/Vps4 family AAA+-type ATPase
MNSNNAFQQVERMLSRATPLIAVSSYDHGHATKNLRVMLAKKDRPVIGWNMADGFTGFNQAGESVLASLDPADSKLAKSGVHAALHVSQKFAEMTVVIVDNLHWFWDKPAVMQALLNLRDTFKSSKRAIIGLTLPSKAPADLIQNMSFVEDALPDEDSLSETVESIYRSGFGNEAEMDAEEKLSIARELRGTSPFRAEQLTALSLTKEGVDRARLRDNARKQINDTPGLSVETGSETFDDIGGLDAVREYMRRYFDGPRRPTVVVRIEEIEKALAGVGTETSGTSGDALGTMLTAMEDLSWTGLLAYGVSGCGKSLLAKASANEFGAKAIRFDINACKGSLVGESEKQIRQAMDVLHAIGGNRVFFIASMNQIASLPPELRRRFASGTWYFDVPTDEARQDIWKISADHFGVEYDGYDATNLTGADIRDIVQRSYELQCTTTEAAQYHVPLCKAAPDAISSSRADATGRYLDATKGGPFRDPSVVESTGNRSFELD